MTGAWAMYRALVGVGLICGLLIVSVYEVTRPIIERNRAEALERAIFEVLPGSAKTASFEWADGELAAAERSGSKERVHAGYDAAGELLGVAIEAEGMGYQDVVKILYGYSVSDRAIIGFAVLESRETPGLGTKIETDPDFLANFEHLDVSGSWEIDTISGATISSKAVADILESSTRRWVPRLREQGQL